MNDEELYLDVTNEVESDTRNSALWAKVIALSEGDEDKAKYLYIKLRVEQIQQDDEKIKTIFTKKKVNEFDLKYMPVAEFSKIKSIPETKVIEMIRDGFYMGQIKDNKWFVSRDGVDSQDNKTSTHSKKNRKKYRLIKQVGVVIGVVIIGTIGALLYEDINRVKKLEADKKQYEAVSITISYDTKHCPEEYPLLTIISNDSKKIVEKVSWSISAYKPGYSNDLVRNHSFSQPPYSSDKILNQGQWFSSCYKVPSLEGSFPAKELNWSVGRGALFGRDIYFKESD